MCDRDVAGPRDVGSRMTTPVRRLSGMEGCGPQRGNQRPGHTGADRDGVTACSSLPAGPWAPSRATLRRGSCRGARLGSGAPSCTPRGASGQPRLRGAPRAAVTRAARGSRGHAERLIATPRWPCAECQARWSASARREVRASLFTSPASINFLCLFFWVRGITVHSSQGCLVILIDCRGACWDTAK